MIKPHDFSRLLLCSEKVFACDRLAVSSKAVRLMLTSKFEQLFTTDFGQLEDQEYRLFNLFQRVLTVIYRRAQTDITGLSLVERLVDAVSRQPAALVKDGQFSNEEYLILSLFGVVFLFLKENWTGKSSLFVNTEKWYEEERVIKSSPELMKQRRDRLENVRFAQLNEQQQAICLELAVSEADFDSSDFGLLRDPKFAREYDSRLFNEHMVINGEDCYTTMKFVNFYMIAKHLLEVLLRRGLGEKYYYLHILKGRLAFLHAQMMSYPTEPLRLAIFENYGGAMRLLEEHRELVETETLALLYIEYAHAVLHFYKYNLCEEYIEKAKQLLGIEFSFTGKLGVRTKYQQFKVAQLTLEVESKQNAALSGLHEEDTPEPYLPKIIKLDDIIDNILYERPVIDHEDKNRELTVFDHILVTAIIRHIQKNSPFDDVQREQVLSYVHQTMNRFNNWSVVVVTLIIRSLNEFNFLKKRERSLLQLHQISDDWNLGKEDTYERQKYLFALNYPSFIEFQTIIIDKYLNMGMVMTACQIYEQLNMLEECVECYFRAGHLDKAKELADKLKLEKPSPKLYCILGDICKDPSWYLKAFELSGNRYARAQRSLAKHYFNQKDLDKAVEHFKVALSINDYHTDSWSLLGFIYMSQNKPHEAIQAYSRVVQIDNSQSFCWANLSNLFMSVGKKAEALSTIEQAAKLNENRWKIWVNYSAIAYENKKFGKFVKCVLKLIDLDKCEAIEDAAVKRLVVAMNMSIEATREKPEEIRQSELVHRDIKTCFEKLVDKQPQRPLIWKYYCDFLHFDFAFYSIKAGIRKLDADKMKVFMLDEPLLDVEHYRRDSIHKRFELTMKECHSVMKVGWEADKQANEEVYQATLRLIDHATDLRDPILNAKLTIHLKAIQKILHEAIGEAVDLSKLVLPAH